MKIYVVAQDQLALLLADKNAAHAIKEFDTDSRTVTIMLDKLAVKVSVYELEHLLKYAQ